jgi:hypothetical protein
LCDALYARGRGRSVLFAGDVEGAEGTGRFVMCAALYAEGRGGLVLFIGVAGGVGECSLYGSVCWRSCRTQ